MTVKQFIYRTPLAKFAKDVEAQIHNLVINSQQTQWNGNRTVYCLSPYKTGTTFLASSFDEGIACHEPYHYVTLKMFEKDFNKFLIKRMNKLNLKLECSGFWAMYIDELAGHEVARDLDYLCILREPSSWITSAVNFWNRPYTHRMFFEYENELVWKPKVGVDIREIFNSEGQVNQQMIDKLIQFYFDFTENTQKLKNVHYIRLKDLKDNMDKIGELIGAKPNMSKSWMRKAKEQNFVYKDVELDQKYNELISNFKLLNE